MENILNQVVSLIVMLETLHKFEEVIFCQCSGGHDRNELESRHLQTTGQHFVKLGM